MGIDAATLQETYEIMRKKLAGIVPPDEIRPKAELAYEINRLKKERNALILGHNYMEPALFISVPDIMGDSLELSRKAVETDCDPIIFCGVRFMAESAKILSPHKTVLLPATRAGCSLAEAITANDVVKLRAKYPGLPVVNYINTYADIKAEVDVCCTSANSVKVVQSFGDRPVIFTPDEYMAKNIGRELNRPVYVIPASDDPADWADLKDLPENVIIGWRGRCEVHEAFTLDDVKEAREQIPDVVVLAHPECSPEVFEAADYGGSTSQMIKYVKESDAPHFFLLTECSMGDNIVAENPGKDILRMCSKACTHMKEVTLEEVLRSLRENVQQIEIEENLRIRAKGSLDRMLEVR